MRKPGLPASGVRLKRDETPVGKRSRPISRSTSITIPPSLSLTSFLKSPVLLSNIKRDAPGKVCGAWPFDEPSPHCDSTMLHDQKYLEHSHPLAGVCTALGISNAITNLEGFSDLEFCYVDRGIVMADGVNHDAYPSAISGGRPSVRQEEKWWLPCPKVPPKGLSEDARKQLQQCRDCTNQILKAALAINSNVLAEMEIPIAYLDTLPKNGKACLGDIIYRYITADQFSPECLLDCLDLSSEHHTLEVANRIESAVHVWKLKDRKKHTNHSKAKRSSWSGRVKGLVADGEKNHLLAKRAENLLHSLRLRFPGLPQTALDMNKIQYNKDVGQSILESYSRVMESLAFNIMARIDDVLYVDDAAKRCAAAESMSFFSRGGLGGLPIQKRMLPSPFSIQHTPYTSPFATPTFCTSPPIIGSPGREPMPIQMSCLKEGVTSHKLEIPMPAELEKLWSYAGNLSGRKISGDAPERD